MSLHSIRSIVRTEKKIAFLENRTAIRVINLKTKKVRTVMDAQYQYSYSDGDQWFEWSPDSKWILSEFIGMVVGIIKTLCF